MEAPSPRYIITRALFLIAMLVAGLYTVSFIKKKQRQTAIVSELKSLSSDSSFFQQFYAEEAKKSLVRAIALIAEANQLGIPPDKTIDRILGMEDEFFKSETEKEEPTPRQILVRSSLRTNYENFRKLGYRADYHTLSAMKSGTLPPIPSGPEAGKKAVVTTLIDAGISPGIEKVIANLEIRPPGAEGRALSDIETATAKKLARDLTDASLIEEPVRDRILAALSKTSAP